MSDIVLPENRALYTDLLEDMHRMRYRLLVQELGWDIPDVQPGYEKDSFDKPSTVYVIVASEDRRSVLACVRLNKTTEPHMLTEVFEDFCDLQPIPRNAHTLECSRYVVDRTSCPTREVQTLVRQHLGIAITEFCLSSGITHLTWLTHQTIYNNIQRTYVSEPLGLPREHPADREIYVAAVSEVDINTWNRQRAALIRPQEHITELRLALTPADETGSRPWAA